MELRHQGVKETFTDTGRWADEQKGCTPRRWTQGTRQGWLNRKLKTQASCKLLQGLPWREKFPVSQDRVRWKVGLELSKQAPLFPLWPLPHRQRHSAAERVAPPGWIPKALPPANITGISRQRTMAQMKEQSKTPERAKPWDRQPIWCRVQNTGNQDAHRTDWAWSQKRRNKWRIPKVE